MVRIGNVARNGNILGFENIKRNINIFWIGNIAGIGKQIRNAKHDPWARSMGQHSREPIDEASPQARRKESPWVCHEYHAIQVPMQRPTRSQPSVGARQLRMGQRSSTNPSHASQAQCSATTHSSASRLRTSQTWYNSSLAILGCQVYLPHK